MQLAYQLNAAGLGVFPCAVSYDQNRERWNKRPVTVRVGAEYESWALTAQRAIDDPAVHWGGCTVLGVPIPPRVVVIDLDVYKPGCSTDAADELFGARLPWQQAHIQNTVSGGAHYAFRLPSWPVRQGDNLGRAGSGIDTRVAGKGFICSGMGYAPAQPFGLLRLVHPDSLPILPDECRAILEEHTAERPTPALPEGGDRDVETIKAALAFIDPTSREVWRDMGFALKHHFHDDEEAGFALWDAWSRGEFWADGCPPSYTGDTQYAQWSSFKAVREGATITAGTLFHAAMRNGWQPPARFDASTAFGAGAAPVETFNALLARVIEEGADSRKTDELINAIRAAGCNELQTVLLRNELKALLRGAKLLDKSLSNIIDQTTTPDSAPRTPGTYSKNHTESAQLFRSTVFPNDLLMRADEVWYAYNGVSWQEIEDAAMLHKLATAMAPSMPQASDITGAYSVLSNLAYREGVMMNQPGGHVLLFQNGALDLYTGRLLPHDPQYLTTNVLPYRYAPGAQAPTWLRFMHDIFEGDAERIALLQEWFGYMLSPTYQYQKIMLLLGPRRAGKGTIGRMLRNLVGELNFTGATLSSFAADDFLDSLRGKTVAFSGDTSKTVNRNKIESVIERIKNISGGDEVDFGRKYKSRMTCTLPTRLTLAANHIPRLFDDSEALSHRMLVIPFDVSYADREDPYLGNALAAEMEGIAVWALQGLARLNAQRQFTVPAASRAEMDFIAESYSPIKGFIDTCCAFEPDGRTSSEGLYEAYRAWATIEQEPRILARKTFISTFKDASRGRGCRYGTKRSGDGVFRGFEGLALREGLPSLADEAFKPKLAEA